MSRLDIGTVANCKEKSRGVHHAHSWPRIAVYIFLMQNRRGTIKTIDEDCLLKGLQRDEVLIRATDVNADRMPLRGNNCASNVDMIVIDRQSPTICTSFGDVSYNGRESWGPLMRERQAVPPWPWATHLLIEISNFIHYKSSIRVKCMIQGEIGFYETRTVAYYWNLQREETTMDFTHLCGNYVLPCCVQYVHFWIRTMNQLRERMLKTGNMYVTYFYQSRFKNKYFIICISLFYTITKQDC